MKYYYIICFFIFFTCSFLPAKSIRILIENCKNDIYFSGKFSIMDGTVKIKEIENISVGIIAENNKIVMNGRAYNKELYFKNNSNGFIKIGNYKYKGSLTVILKGHLYLINNIDIEEYIKGVLPNEISPGWPVEILKAQAIAARTFAYYYAENNKKEIYDLTDSTYSQVYKGTLNENGNFNQFIDTTKDQVMVYDNNYVQAFFHSCCGGYTENAEKVWGRSLPYLRGTPCNYCADSLYDKWEARFTEQEIIKILKEKNYPVDRIRAILPSKRSSTGRWIEIKILGDKKNIILSGNDFRIIFGINKIRSTKFNIQRQGQYFMINGKGWGHGVGFCQWGAKKMAEKGYKYYQILSFYYRGMTLRSVDSLKK